jgi:hypothetical protein
MRLIYINVDKCWATNLLSKNAKEECCWVKRILLTKIILVPAGVSVRMLMRWYYASMILWCLVNSTTRFWCRWCCFFVNPHYHTTPPELLSTYHQFLHGISKKGMMEMMKKGPRNENSAAGQLFLFWPTRWMLMIKNNECWPMLNAA